MNMKRFFQFFAFTLIMLVSGPTIAFDHTGSITLYHLNSEKSGRGVCVQMSPALPNEVSNWACLWKTNPLYREITDLLLEGFVSRKTCKLWWAKTDVDKRALISIAECR